jgi:hypothetical protein
LQEALSGRHRRLAFDRIAIANFSTFTEPDSLLARLLSAVRESLAERTDSARFGHITTVMGFQKT